MADIHQVTEDIGTADRKPPAATVKQEPSGDQADQEIQCKIEESLYIEIKDETSEDKVDVNVRDSVVDGGRESQDKDYVVVDGQESQDKDSVVDGGRESQDKDKMLWLKCCA